MAKAFNDNSGVTANSQQIELLKKHFPQCFDQHGAFMADKLQAIVGDSGTAFSKESYRLNWLGKSYARLLANENPLTFLSEDKTHNQKPEHQGSENLLIKGDNPEVLKHLKQAYAEQVKMIYIDPPYNTGSDGFVYQDDRKFTPNELARLAGIDVDEAQRILAFTQSKANSHSAWLTFMYPRLYVARELLKDDGVIFISIDDNEVAQLRILCDEVFGEGNFIAVMVWEKGRKNDAKLMSVGHEYILVYAKSLETLKNNKIIWREEKPGAKDIWEKYVALRLVHGNDNALIEAELQAWFSSLPKTNPAKKWSRYKRVDENGPWRDRDISWPGGGGPDYDVIHPVTKLPCKVPESGWRYASFDEMQRQIKLGLVEFREDHTQPPFRKAHIRPIPAEIDNEPDFGDEDDSNEEQLATQVRGTYFYKQSQVAVKALRNLLDAKAFNNPKDHIEIAKLISYVTADDPNAIVMDFFAGNGTTGHSVMETNVSDNGRRRYVLVQIAEPCDKKSEASKVGYQTIFEITKARIEKAAAKIKSENPDYQGDLGFKLFETVPLPDGYLDEVEKLDSPNFDLFDGSILDDKQLEDLLTTWKVYDGIALTAPLTPIDLAGYTGWQQQKILYLVHKDFRTQALTALLQKLDDTDDKAFDIERLVLFAHNFDSKHQREISEALTQYQNRKQKSVSVELRY